MPSSYRRPVKRCRRGKSNGGNAHINALCFSMTGIKMLPQMICHSSTHLFIIKLCLIMALAALIFAFWLSQCDFTPIAVASVLPINHLITDQALQKLHTKFKKNNLLLCEMFVVFLPR